MAKSIDEQIDGHMRTVEKVYRDTLGALRDKGVMGIRLAEYERSIDAIESLRPRIDDWKKQGEAFKKSDTAPGGGWVAAGNQLMAGIRDIYDTGEKSALANIEQTKDGMQKSAAAIGQATARATSAVVGTAGGVAWQLVKPFVPLLLGAVLVVVVGRKLVNRVTGG